jgi:hypothetical protein
MATLDYMYKRLHLASNVLFLLGVMVGLWGQWYGFKAEQLSK